MTVMTSQMLILVFACQFSTAMQGTNPYSKIWKKISENYDPGFKPVIDASTKVNVNISCWLMNVLNVNEAEETIEMTHWVLLAWNDEHLRWSPADFGGVGSIILPADRVWQPDINYEQQANELITPIDRDRLFARLNYNGDIAYAWSVVVRLSCAMDVVDFPFDTQTCVFTISSWQYLADDITINVSPSASANEQQFVESSEWTLLAWFGNQSVTTNDGETSFETKWTMVLERKSTYYVITLFMPTYVITALCIVGLFSPSNANLEREEKCSMGATALLTMAVVLLMVSDLMPKSESSFPRLGRFIVAEMALTSLATMVAVIIMHIHAMGEGGRGVPRWVATLLRMDAASRDGGISQCNNGHSMVNSIERLASLPNGGHTNSMTHQKLQCREDKEVMALLRGVKSMLGDLVERARSDAMEGERVLDWKVLCLRLDLVCMAVFNVINILMTIAYICLPQIVL